MMKQCPFRTTFAAASKEAAIHAAVGALWGEATSKMMITVSPVLPTLIWCTWHQFVDISLLMMMPTKTWCTNQTSAKIYVTLVLSTSFPISQKKKVVLFLQKYILLFKWKNKRQIWDKLVQQQINQICCSFFRNISTPN